MTRRGRRRRRSSGSNGGDYTGRSRTVLVASRAGCSGDGSSDGGRRCICGSVRIRPVVRHLKMRSRAGAGEGKEGRGGAREEGPERTSNGKWKVAFEGRTREEKPLFFLPSRPPLGRELVPSGERDHLLRVRGIRSKRASILDAKGGVSWEKRESRAWGERRLHGRKARPNLFDCIGPALAGPGSRSGQCPPQSTSAGLTLAKGQKVSISTKESFTPADSSPDRAPLPTPPLRKPAEED